MPIDIQVEFDHDNLAAKLRAVDPDTIKDNASKAIAEELVTQVTDAIRREDDIISPAMNGPNARGRGPSLIQRAAWKITPSGDSSYLVSPHPRVRTRAIVLNYGYPGRITPNDEGGVLLLRGVDPGYYGEESGPVFRQSVEGPDETLYWQSAVTNLEKTGKVEEIGDAALGKELKDKGLIDTIDGDIIQYERYWRD